MGSLLRERKRPKLVAKESNLLRAVAERIAAQNKKKSQLGYFSTDLVFQMFLLLPIKSLVRFSCACKMWNNLINSSTFVDAKLQCSERVFMFFDQDDSYERPSSFSIDLKVNLKQFTMFPPKEPKNNLYLHFLEIQDTESKIVDLNISCSGHILAACNGLILVNLGGNQGLVVMNPMTRKLIQLPLGTLLSRDSYGLMLSSSGKYKVVHLFFDALSFLGCEIITVGARSWRAVDGPTSGLIPNFGERPVSAIGALHWGPYKMDSSYIVSMDIDNEKFLTIKPPTTGRRYDRVIELHGFLGFVTHPEQNCIEIWILKKLCGDNWRKEHSIIGGVTRDLVPISTLRNGRQVFLKKIHGDKICYVYDFDLQEMKEVEVDYKFVRRNGFFLPHVNSLASWETLSDQW